jgi:hypothetical protein
MKKALIVLFSLSLVAIAYASDLTWTGNNQTTDGRTFAPDQMGSMTYYIRINKTNPKDNTGTLYGGTRWYYAGESRNGVQKWPGDNNIEATFQGWGMEGQSVSLTVSQAFTDTDGVERDSALSAPLAWTVPVPFVPKRSGAPSGLGIR